MGIEHKETSGQPMPTAEAEYVVVGLTNGPGFHANPCLADQVAWVRGARPADRGVLGDQLAGRGRAGAVRRAARGRLRAGAVQRAVDGDRRAGVASGLARRRAGALLRVEQQQGGQRARSWSAPRRAIWTRASGSASTPRRTSGSRWSATCRWACPSGAPRVRPRRPRRSTAAARTGRSRAARRSWGSGSRTPRQEHHLPRRRRRPRALVQPHAVGEINVTPCRVYLLTARHGVAVTWSA